MPTVEELKQGLTEAGVDFPAKATKAELQELAAAEATKRKPLKTRHDGDIIIAMNITTADGKSHKDEIRITNPRGVIPASDLGDPDFVTDSLKEELRGRFGASHVA